MIKLERNNGKVSVEAEGNIIEIAADFDHVVITGLEKLGEQKEEIGLYPVGEGALRGLAKLIAQFVAKEAGAEKNPFAVLVKADEFKALEERARNFIKAEIDALNFDEIEEISSDDGKKMLLEFLFGFIKNKENQEQPDRPQAVWTHTGVMDEWECSNCKLKMSFIDGVSSHPDECPICGAEMVDSVVPEGGPDGEK